MSALNASGSTAYCTVTESKWARWLIWSRTSHPSSGVGLSQSSALSPLKSLSSSSLSAWRSSAIWLMSTGTVLAALPLRLALLAERLGPFLGVLAHVHRLPDALGLVERLAHGELAGQLHRRLGR